jgi:hypothetical protein
MRPTPHLGCGMPYGSQTRAQSDPSRVTGRQLREARKPARFPTCLRGFPLASVVTGESDAAYAPPKALRFEGKAGKRRR